eukprot:TRINITY_DN16013_c0_g1_i1.p1 TRINITY_DN16013_c0_g1~~TRINITY_DN16013_c0_g1_i1.p1  ORF type:complete len:368 (-),score=63.68 TRINITY_DN16013_c0_g1_i1:60-1163(-)
MAIRLSRCNLGRGAIHPNGTNFRRTPRLDVVARTRRLCEMGLIKKTERPAWLEWCERVPPMENHSLHLQARTVRNPYPRMLEFLLNKYPDLRFQDCYVDGNDWSAGNDSYRDDHPAMQFVARQLDLMRRDGLSKKKAFEETEKMFKGRREYLEREQKVMMASAYDLDIKPMFTTGQAYLQVEMAKSEAGQLNQIRDRLRQMAARAQEAARPQEAAEKENEQEADVLRRPRGMELTEMESVKMEKKSTDDVKKEEVLKLDKITIPDETDDTYGSDEAPKDPEASPIVAQAPRIREAMDPGVQIITPKKRVSSVQDLASMIKARQSFEKTFDDGNESALDDRRRSRQEAEDADEDDDFSFGHTEKKKKR